MVLLDTGASISDVKCCSRFRWPRSAGGRPPEPTSHDRCLRHHQGAGGTTKARQNGVRMVINQTARLGDGVNITDANCSRCWTVLWLANRGAPHQVAAHGRHPGRYGGAPSRRRRRLLMQSTPQQPSCRWRWAVGTQAGRSRHQPQVTVHHARRQTGRPPFQRVQIGWRPLHQMSPGFRPHAACHA